MVHEELIRHLEAAAAGEGGRGTGVCIRERLKDQRWQASWLAGCATRGRLPYRSTSTSNRTGAQHTPPLPSRSLTWQAA